MSTRLGQRINSVPMWVKIMGIVVLPLSLVLLIAVLGIRWQVRMYLLEHSASEELRSLLAVLSRDLLATTLITAAFGLLLAVALSLILTRPLNHLLAVIRQVQDGNLAARVDVQAHDEIGTVQKAFNQMLTSMQDSLEAEGRLNAELGMLNQLLSAVAFGETVHQVTSTALAQAIHIFGADVGTFYAYDDSEQVFTLQASHGFQEGDVLLPRRDAATTPMRRALVEGHPVIIEEVQRATELTPELVEIAVQAGYRTLVCAPVWAHGKICGVLNLGKRGQLAFEENDLALLESVCSIIGLGLEKARLLDDLRRKENEMRHALRRAVTLQEDERRRLSRELHDEIGQALTSILIRLKTLQQETADPDVVDRLDGLRYLTGRTIEELRRLAMDLRPAALDNLGIVPALRWYTEQTAANTGRTIIFDGPEKAVRLPEAVEIVLYRTAQEGIANALRHGEAANIQLALRLQPTAVWLEVNDDGAGFDPDEVARGLGLVGLDERLSLLEGSYRVESQPGAGTRLWVEIPLGDGPRGEAAEAA